MKKIIILIIFVIIFLTLDVNAVACDESTINEYRTLAELVKVRYELNDEASPYLNVTFYNINENFNIISGINNDFVIKKIDESSTFTFQIYNLIKVKKLEFEVNAINLPCITKSLRTIEVTLPRYNELANSELCKKDPNNDYCQKLLFDDNPINYRELEKIINSKIKDKGSSNEEYKKDYTYYYIGFGVILIVVISFILIKVKKRVV